MKENIQHNKNRKLLKYKHDKNHKPLKSCFASVTNGRVCECNVKHVISPRQINIKTSGCENLDCSVEMVFQVVQV